MPSATTVALTNAIRHALSNADKGTRQAFVESLQELTDWCEDQAMAAADLGDEENGDRLETEYTQISLLLDAAMEAAEEDAAEVSVDPPTPTPCEDTTASGVPTFEEGQVLTAEWIHSNYATDQEVEGLYDQLEKLGLHLEPFTPKERTDISGIYSLIMDGGLIHAPLTGLGSTSPGLVYCGNTDYSGAGHTVQVTCKPTDRFILV